jgi:hypothetical protein
MTPPSQTLEEAVEKLVREYREVHGYNEEDARLAAATEGTEGGAITDEDLDRLVAEVLEWEGIETTHTHGE